MKNLIQDSQCFVLSNFIGNEANLPSIGVSHSVISNGFNSIPSLFGIESYSNFLYFRKESPSSTKDSIKIEEVNYRNINLAFQYQYNDLSSTSRKIYFPIDFGKFDPQKYLNKFFTLDLDLVTSFSSISNINIDFELLIRDQTTEYVLQRQSRPIYYNPNFLVSAHTGFKRFKNFRSSFKTLKSLSVPFKNSTDDFSSYGVYLAISFPSSSTLYSINFANMFLSFGQNTEKSFLPLDQSLLNSKSSLEISKVKTRDLEVTNNLSSTQDLSVGRDASVQGDLLVYGISKLATTLQFYNSDKTQIFGSITKSSAAGNIVFTNANGSRAELDALALRSRLADLAEYHVCSNDLTTGDLVQISKSSKYDVEKCTNTSKCIGVVSSDPGIKMNSSLIDKFESSSDFSVFPIGYTGIIHVNVLGIIKKGDYVKVHKKVPGKGKRSFFKTSIMSLDSSKDKSIKKIRCLVQA